MTNHAEKLSQNLSLTIPAVSVSPEGTVLAQTEAAKNIIPLGDPKLLTHLVNNRLPFNVGDNIYQPIIVPNPEDQTYSVIAIDITSARYDALTGVPNRAAIKERTSALENSRKPVGVIFIDLDEFKSVNDNLGHHAGDEVLIAVAGLFRDNNIFRKDIDLIGRYGGDEFIVLLDGITQEVLRDKLNIIEECRQKINERREIARLPLLKFSLETAIHQSGSVATLQDTIIEADKRMYSKKEKMKQFGSDDGEIDKRLDGLAVK